MNRARTAACVIACTIANIVLFNSHVSMTSLHQRPINCLQHHIAIDIADGVPIAPLVEMWRDCSQGIYLDVGTNVAVQIRKLYEPKQFPGANVIPVFDKFFGHNRKKVCAVGFEPNSAHTAYLQTANAYFKQYSLPVHVFTGVAVSSHRGNATFFNDQNAPKNVHEWGASLAPWNPHNDTSSTMVQLVDLHNFILNYVVPIVRDVKQRTGKAPPVMMKLDIEGAEFVVMPALMVSGALCHVDLVFAEWHDDRMRLAMPGRSNMSASEMHEAFEGLRSTTNNECKVKFMELDDETYVDGTAIPFAHDAMNTL